MACIIALRSPAVSAAYVFSLGFLSSYLLLLVPVLIAFSASLLTTLIYISCESCIGGADNHEDRTSFVTLVFDALFLA